MMQMDNALWPSGRSRRIHPERHVTGRCIGAVQRERLIGQKILLRDMPVFIRITIHNDKLFDTAVGQHVRREG